jgi:NADH dehydrogenase FAD-containing subunit
MEDPMGNTEAHRVVVAGGGFGGLSVTKKLAKVPVELQLIDRTNHQLFQPLPYEVAKTRNRGQRLITVNDPYLGRVRVVRTSDRQMAG